MSSPTNRLLDSEVEAFVGRLRERLEVGAREYGSASFRRPPSELLAEIQDELCDVAGWGVVLWVRIARLRERVERLHGAGGAE